MIESIIWWRTLEEERPKDSVDLLLYTDDKEVYSGYWFKDEERFFTEGGYSFIFSKVLFWAYPPKIEVKKQ